MRRPIRVCLLAGALLLGCVDLTLPPPLQGNSTEGGGGANPGSGGAGGGSATGGAAGDGIPKGGSGGTASGGTGGGSGGDSTGGSGTGGSGMPSGGATGTDAMVPADTAPAPDAALQLDTSAPDVAAPQPDLGQPKDTAPPKLDTAPPDLRAPDAMLSPNGANCGKKADCASDLCVDGRCCDLPCTGLCSACNIPGKEGTCSFSPAGTDPALECATALMSSCGQDGQCNGQGACRLWVAGTPCAPASCTGSTATAPSTCDGDGVCNAGASSSCDRYLCSGMTCGTGCTFDNQCTAGNICLKGACALPKLASLVVHDTANAAGWSIQPNFATGMTGAHPWSDTQWAPSYVTSVDAGANMLLGDQWLKVVTLSKDYAGGPQATITLNGPADVYMAVDDRWGAVAWTAGWTDSGLNIVVWESTSRPALPFSLFTKTAQTGALDLPMIGADNEYDYFIIVH
jgi:hypothetical protein